MARYKRDEAREWAREKLVGVVNCTIPSFTTDLKRINEKAIRHDIRLAIARGFIGTLGVSEVSIALPEYLDFLRIMTDEAAGRLVVTHHASWNNLEQNIEASAAQKPPAPNLCCCPIRRTSIRRPSRTSTTTPRRCATRPISR